MSTRTLDEKIYVTNLGGQHPVLLIDRGDFVDHPAFIGDGVDPSISRPVPRDSEIVFHSLTVRRAGSGDLWATYVRRGEAVQITTTVWQELYPSWSPDGRTLVFSSSRDGTFDIYKMQSDRPGLAQLTNSGDVNLIARFASTGNRLVFSSDRQGPENLCIVNADGSGMRRITTTKNGRDLDAVWTASGEEIVFASDRDGSFDLYHTTLSGGRVNRLTHFDGIARSPTISPDGLTIAFELNRETSSGIYSISADGSNFMPLIEDGGDYKMPAFSPDGRFIAFASKQPPLETFGIYVMNLQTGEFWLVADTPGDDLSPQWRPHF